MRLNAVKILEISITKTPKKEILEYLRKYLGSPAKDTQKTLTIATPNAEQIVYAAHHTWFQYILNKADLTLPDSTGVVWAGRFLGNASHLDRMPGVDFMEDLVRISAKQRVPIALIGGRDGVAVKALECLRQKYGHLAGIAGEAPEFVEKSGKLILRNHELGIMTYEASYIASHDSLFTIHYSHEEDYFNQLALKIVELDIQVVFIALGPPKQELFMEALAWSLRGARGAAAIPSKNVKPVILMVVGGSFDEISGRLLRAPTWVSVVGMKWLWRLMLEPWRIMRQRALVEFVLRVVKAKLQT